MNTASPGATSRTSWNDRLSSATLSEASMYSVPRGVRALAEHQRPDAVRIAKAEDAVADDHGHHRVAAAAAPVDGAERGEDVRRRDARGADALQLGGEYVEQHLGIGGGVEVAPVLADQHLGELGGVGQVAVVPEADAVRAR